MLDLTRNWIVPAVCKQLEIAPDDKVQNDKGYPPYDQDGSRQIRLVGGKSIQITNFVEHSPLYLAWVSDSYCRIKAIFSRRSTDDFQRIHKRPFSKDTVGAVLAITDYYLIFNPKLPQSQRVMLKIEAFTLQGSEGSGDFGHPILVEDIESIRRLLSGLKTDSTNGGLSHSRSLDSISPVQTQADMSADDMLSSENATQATFSTQAPLGLSNGARVGVQRNSGSSKQALLSLLKHNPPKAQQASVEDHEPSQINISPYTRMPLLNNHPLEGRSASVSLLSTSEGHSLGSSTSALLHVERQGTSRFTDKYSENDVPLSQISPLLDFSKSRNHKETMTGDVGMQPKKTFVKSAIGKSLAVRGEGGGSVKCKRIILPSQQAPYISKSQIREANNQWEGLTRIPHKYVRISKDQRAILDYDDAWYPPASGNIQPLVNIPANVLLALQSFHDNVKDGASDVHSNSYIDGHSDNDSNLGTIGIDLQQCEADIGQIESSHIQTNGRLPSFNASLSHVTDVPHMSQDLDDCSSVGISWSSSPNRAEIFPGDHSVRESPQAPSIGDRFSAPNLSQSQILPSDIPSTPSSNAESPSAKEDKSESEGALSLVLQRHLERCHEPVTRRLTRSSRKDLKGFRTYYSSSPVEMDLSVPYALDNQNQWSDDVVTTDVLDAGPPASSPEQRSQSRAKVERAPCAVSKGRSTPPETVGVKSDEENNLRQHRDDILSDPIIPGTFRSEAAKGLNLSASLSPTHSSGLEGESFEADQIISSTPSAPSRLHYYPSVANIENHLARGHGHGGTLSLPNRSVRGVGVGKDLPTYVIMNSEASEARKESQDTESIDLETSALVNEPSQISIPGTQTSSLDPLPASVQTPIADSIISSMLTTPVKRPLSRMSDMIERSPKRRRPLPASIFSSCRESDMAIDPSEMAKANRRKFLQGLSGHGPTSPSSPHRHDATLAVPSFASKAVTEIALREVLIDTPIDVRDVEMSQKSQNLPEVKASFSDMETLPTEKYQHMSLRETKLGEDTVKRNSASDQETSNGNVPNETIESNQGTKLKFPDPTVAKLQDWHDRLAPTKSQSRDNQAPLTKTVLDMFTTAYPTYSGNKKDFIKACVYLKSLQSMNKAPHPSLWDDFIRAFSAEFINHVKESKLLKQKAIPALDFYNNHVLEPLYMKRIMGPYRLPEALQLDPEETAKCCTIVDQKRNSQRSQEPASNECSQTTRTSDDSAQSQEAAATIFTPTPSTPKIPKLSTITSQGPLQHMEVEMLSLRIPSVASTADKLKTTKKPFFETPSQIITQDRHEATQPRILAIGQQVRKYTTSQNTRNNVESACNELFHGHGGKRPLRHLPWSSSSQDVPKAENLQEQDQQLDEPAETTEAIPGQFDVGSQSKTLRLQTYNRSLNQREGSPILGSMTPNSSSTAETVVQSNFSVVSSNLSFDTISKNVNLPMSKYLGRRATSMPGPGGGRIPSWLDFSKSFVPRLKRQSSIFSRRSIPGPSPSRIKRDEPEMLRSAPQVEPDTQV